MPKSSTFRLPLFAAVLAILISTPVRARSQDNVTPSVQNGVTKPVPDPVVRRAAQLRRGINTALWFSQLPGHTDVERLRSFITEDDLQLISQLGFDHIRLPVDPVPLEGWEHGDANGIAFMVELDRVIKAAEADGLNVILDLQPDEPYKQALLAGDESATAFATLWGSLATHYAQENPDRLFFELMNEPEQIDSVRWAAVETGAVTAIRAAAPEFTVIASALNLDKLPDLEQLQPLPLPNILYTFHNYDPIWFTHQGAPWAGAALGPLHDVPYPSTPENVLPNVDQETDDIYAKAYLRRYGLERWNAARVESLIHTAAAWGLKHHLPVYCGEFGVHRGPSAPADRERFLRDTRVALEHNHIGWAMWEYQVDFGMVTKENGKTTVDTGVVKALGLTPVVSSPTSPSPTSPRTTSPGPASSTPAN
jgi:endoglucanase